MLVFLPVVYARLCIHPCKLFYFNYKQIYSVPSLTFTDLMVHISLCLIGLFFECHFRKAEGWGGHEGNWAYLNSHTPKVKNSERNGTRPDRVVGNQERYLGR